MRGRRFGGTAVLCMNNIACSCTSVTTNGSRGCAGKFSIKHCNDVIVISIQALSQWKL